MRMKPVALALAAIFTLSAVADPSVTADAPVTLNVEVVNHSKQKAFIKIIGSSLRVDKTSAAIAAGGATTFKLNNVSAGRIYVSYGQALSGAKEPDGANPTDPNYRVRFDKAELTYVDTSGGKINLTAVDHYAIPMLLQTFITNESDGKLIPIDQFSLARGKTGKQLLTDLLNVTTGKNGGKALINDKTGNFVRLLSPVKCPGAYANMKNYIDKSIGATVNLTGTYFGTPRKDYNYSGTIHADKTILSMRGEQNITINSSTLYSSLSAIYTCNGTYFVGPNPSYVSKNDFWSAVYRDFVCGYNFGYIAGKYGNKSANWWDNAPFAAANPYYNQYAAVIDRSYPGAYGFPFSDRQRHVLADIGRKISALRLTLLDDNQAPSYLPYEGVLNPTTKVTTFRTVFIFPQSIQNLPFIFGKTKCNGGYINIYNKGATKNPSSLDGKFLTARVDDICALEGYNRYDLVWGSAKYMVLAYVENKAVKWAMVAGGGDSNWDGKVLYTGGLQAGPPKPKQMSQGSMIDVSVSDFVGEPGVDTFAEPPTVFARYGNGKKTARLKVLTSADKFPTETVQCFLPGKPQFSVQNAINGNPQTFLNTEPCGLHVKLNGVDMEDPLFHAGRGTLCGPFITSATNMDGTSEIQSVQPGEQIIVNGYHFGKNPPKVSLVYFQNNRNYFVPCKVVKPLFFEDESGQSGNSCMDLDSADGDSRVLVQLPVRFPRGWLAADWRAVLIDNRVDKAMWLIQENVPEEE